VELLLNLAWAAVVVGFCGIWLAGRRCWREASLLPAVCVQLIALAMLSAILLPVISVTDDLQACQNPAEVERTVTRNDHHLCPDHSPHSLPVALALLVACLHASSLPAITNLTTNESWSHQQAVYLRALWSRPPPSV